MCKNKYTNTCILKIIICSDQFLLPSSMIKDWVSLVFTVSIIVDIAYYRNITTIKSKQKHPVAKQWGADERLHWDTTSINE